MPVLNLGLNRAPLHYKLTELEPGERMLEAWWPETMCSPLPCKVRLEQWSDNEWRAAGQIAGSPTADRAARRYLREHPDV